MRRFPCLLLAAVAVCAVLQPLSAQKFLPKTIQFKGDPEYSDRELMEAAGLKKGIVLDYAEMNAHSQQLLATGMFATLTRTRTSSTWSFACRSNGKGQH